MNRLIQCLPLFAVLSAASACQAEPEMHDMASLSGDAPRETRSQQEAEGGEDGDHDDSETADVNANQCRIVEAEEAAFSCPQGLNSFETWLPFGDVHVNDGGSGETANADYIEFQGGSSLIGYIRFQDIQEESLIAVSVMASGSNNETLAVSVIEGCETLDANGNTGFISFSESNLGSTSVDLTANEANDCFTVVLNPLNYPAQFAVWDFQYDIQ